MLPHARSSGSQRGTVRRYPTLDRTGTVHTSASVRAKHTGFGGFPWPHEIISSLLKHFFPDANRRLTRTLTMPRTMTVTSQRQPSMAARVVPYISFDAVVGRNSVFHSLTNEQLEELGGVEYRALTSLLWIVAGVSLFLLFLVEGAVDETGFATVSHISPDPGVDNHRSLHGSTQMAGSFVSPSSA